MPTIRESSPRLLHPTHPSAYAPSPVHPTPPHPTPRAGQSPPHARERALGTAAPGAEPGAAAGRRMR